jgi:hypothetical protein
MIGGGLGLDSCSGTTDVKMRGRWCYLDVYRKRLDILLGVLESVLQHVISGRERSSTAVLHSMVGKWKIYPSFRCSRTQVHGYDEAEVSPTSRICPKCCSGGLPSARQRT